VKTVSASGAHYYALKNEGVRFATADIIALTDSDVRLEPGWLSSIVTGVTEGADVCCGITLFSSEDGRGSNHALMQVAASISWGFVVRRALDDKTAVPAGFLSHNVGFRTSVFRRHQYRTDLGRTCAGSLLYEALCDAGARIVLQPHQRVAHNFSLRWWVFRLHRRFGYEVFMLRRLKPAAKWLPLFKPVEPLLTMMWHVTLDIPQWLRFSRLLRVPRWRRLALLPAVVGMSVLARAGEMIGMYETIVMPAAMKRFAESN
jgi:glycosyltransferase involved in cell wall biosynthesis